MSRKEIAVVLGIILVLSAILVPVVRKVREDAIRAAEMHQRQTAPMTFED